ncbi:MAG: motility protein A [Bdellovibrionales bacterium]
MNFSGIIGVISAAAVFVFVIIESASGREIFLNSHAIIIVMGGTMAATLLCFPIGTLVTLVKVFFQKIIGKHNVHHNEVIAEVVELARGYIEDPAYLQNNYEKIKNPFLKEAVELTVQSGISASEVDAILEMRALTHFKRYEGEAAIFKTISKFPPAFGLMGTTVGMIALLQGIGTPDSFKTIGSSMAVGLVATFYGIAIANLIFIPMGENLSKLNKEDEVMREVVIQGIKLLRLKSHPLVVEEYLKSFLLPKERQSLPKQAA